MSRHANHIAKVIAAVGARERLSRRFRPAAG
jgi:hypothetical protein